jgi:hypothetical protein
LQTLQGLEQVTTIVNLSKQLSKTAEMADAVTKNGQIVLRQILDSVTMPSIDLQELLGGAMMPSIDLQELLGGVTMPSIHLQELLGGVTMPSIHLQELLGGAMMPSIHLQELLGGAMMPSIHLQELLGGAMMPSIHLQELLGGAMMPSIHLQELLGGAMMPPAYMQEVIGSMGLGLTGYGNATLGGFTASSTVSLDVGISGAFRVERTTHQHPAPIQPIDSEGIRAAIREELHTWGGEYEDRISMRITAQLRAQLQVAPTTGIVTADQLPMNPPHPEQTSWEAVFDWFYRAPRWYCLMLLVLAKLIGYNPKYVSRKHREYEAEFGQRPIPQRGDTHCH